MSSPVRSNQITISPLNETLIHIALGMLGAAWLLSLSHLEPGPIGWVTMRATGLIAYVALAVSSALGPLMASRYAPRWLPVMVQYGWHGLLSGFALVLGALHGVFILVGGQYAQGLAALLIPGLSRTQPLAVGLGTLATYLLIIVYVSFAYRARLGPKLARALHFLAYPAFTMATLHGLWSGSDPALPLYLTASLVVAGTTVLRILEA